MRAGAAAAFIMAIMVFVMELASALSRPMKREYIVIHRVWNSTRVDAILMYGLTAGLLRRFAAQKSASRKQIIEAPVPVRSRRVKATFNIWVMWVGLFSALYLAGNLTAAWSMPRPIMEARRLGATRARE